KKDAGYEFSILTTVTTGGEQVWESESTMLYRTGGGSKKKSSPPPAEPATDVIEWSVPDNIGRRYGAVSGDRNPIHLYPLTAKLLGFKRQIAHGMWSKARCLAELEPSLPNGPFSVDVQFKLPMFIPTKVKFEQKTVDNGVDFRLLAKDGIKPHLHGQIRVVEGCPAPRPQKKPARRPVFLCLHTWHEQVSRSHWPEYAAGAAVAHRQTPCAIR